MTSITASTKGSIYLSALECESCAKAIEVILRKHQGVLGWQWQDHQLMVEFDPKVTSLEKVLESIKERGYKAKLSAQQRKSITERLSEFLTEKEKYAIEYKMLLYVIATFILVLAAEVAVIFFMNRTDNTFFPSYGWWIFYLGVAVVSLLGALWHFKAYKAEINCMVGMMLGMTFGMQIGMMIGPIIAVTNGFFVGGLVGMLLGVAGGVYVGKCCGVMGILQGMMAGIMGGLMGPMITIMMFNDHLLWFMPIYMILNVIILGGMAYLIFEEVVEDQEFVLKKPAPFWQFLLLTAVVLGFLLVLMIFGPPSLYFR